MFLAKKVGGTDDGTLYALKAINVPYVVAREKIYNRNSINNERDVRLKFNVNSICPPIRLLISNRLLIEYRMK